MLLRLTYCRNFLRNYSSEKTAPSGDAFRYFYAILFHSC